MGEGAEGGKESSDRRKGKVRGGDERVYGEREEREVEEDEEAWKPEWERE